MESLGLQDSAGGSEVWGVGQVQKKHVARVQSVVDRANFAKRLMEMRPSGGAPSKLRRSVDRALFCTDMGTVSAFDCWSGAGRTIMHLYRVGEACQTNSYVRVSVSWAVL